MWCRLMRDLIQITTLTILGATLGTALGAVAWSITQAFL
jgi:hypothetical protein